MSSAKRIRRLSEARDPVAPADPGGPDDRQVNPSLIRRPSSPPPAGRASGYEGGDFLFWTNDSGTPFRTDEKGYEGDVFSDDDDAWMKRSLPTDDLFPSTPEEVAGLIGGRHRLTEPSKGAMPVPSPKEGSYAPSPPLAEADTSADFAPDMPEPAPPLPEGSMTEQQIRDAGVRIDLPFEIPDPADISYEDTGQKEWVPPEGWDPGPPLAGFDEGAEGGSSGATGPGG
jgi:hypothetical protein